MHSKTQIVFIFHCLQSWSVLWLLTLMVFNWQRFPFEVTVGVWCCWRSSAFAFFLAPLYKSFCFSSLFQDPQGHSLRLSALKTTWCQRSHPSSEVHLDDTFTHWVSSYLPPSKSSHFLHKSFTSQELQPTSCTFSTYFPG